MEYRRLRGDMIQVFKILNGTDRLDAENLFQFNKGNCRGHSRKLFKQRCNKEIRKWAFSQRIIDNWNSLTEEIVSAESLNAFKNRLDKYWKAKWYQVSF